VQPQMGRRRFLTQIFGGSALLGLNSNPTIRAAGDSSSIWKAGLAKTVITPEKAVWLAGYGTKRVPTGKIHDLWMKALALEDAGGKRAVLITSDFQGVPKSMSDPTFAQVKKLHGLERDQIMFTFSHNHCGPRLGDDLVDYYPVETEQVELVEEYTALMIKKVVELVG
jgi:neutral ceramidase